MQRKVKVHGSDISELVETWLDLFQIGSDIIRYPTVPSSPGLTFSENGTIRALVTVSKATYRRGKILKIDFFSKFQLTNFEVLLP